MNFKRYNSIENVRRLDGSLSKTVDYIVTHGYGGGVWVVHEKMHGANLSLWYDGESLRAARRNSFLEPDENFYNHQSILEKYGDAILDMWGRFQPAHSLAVYGELIGGYYPHPDVEKDPGATRVQKGVHYLAGNDFVAFDVAIDGEYINEPQYDFLLSTVGIPAAPLVFTGTFQQTLQQQDNFPSRVPALFGLPPIKGNICEGIVIKPEKPAFFPNGSRVILKKKNPAFAENASEPKVRKPQEPLSEEAVAVYQNMVDMLVENRLRNVLSREGPIGQKEFGRLMGALMKDVVGDLGPHNLEKAEWKRVAKLASKEATNLIRPHFQTIVDGDF